MNCPSCTSDESQVMSTRSVSDKVVRLRRCCACNHRFHTTEMPSENLATMEEAAQALRSFATLTQKLNATPAHS